MKSSIIKKVSMALSGLFLVIFLTQHLAINLTSIIPDNGKTFNAISHFMGYNPVVQFILQPILMFGVCFHFIMGFVLEYQNRQARNEKYIYTECKKLEKCYIFYSFMVCINEFIIYGFSSIK